MNVSVNVSKESLAYAPHDMFPTDKWCSGCSDIIMASEDGHIDCMRILIDAGADMFLMDDCGNNSLDISISRGHTECEMLLWKEMRNKLREDVLGRLTRRVDQTYRRPRTPGITRFERQMLPLPIAGGYIALYDIITDYSVPTVWDTRQHHDDE